MNGKKDGKRKTGVRLAAELESCRRRVQELEQSLTEMKETLRAAGKSEERLRLIAENMTDIIVLIDPNGTYQYASPSFEAVLGYSPAPNGRLGFEFVHPEDMPAVQRAFMKGILTQSPEKVEYRYRHANGAYIWLEAAGRPLLDEKDNLAGAVLCLRDITDRKRAEERQRESEERFRFLAENMADIVWTLDLDLNTTYVSPSIEKTLGFSPEQRKRQTVQEMMTPDSLLRVITLFVEELRRDEQPDADLERHATIEVEYYHADGRTVWMENRVKALRDKTGAIVGVYGSSRDITARKQAEEALVRSEKKYHDLVETINETIYETDEYGVVTFVSATALRLRGYEPSEIVGKRITELVYREDLPRLLEMYQKILTGPIPPNEYRLNLKTGGYIWVQASSRAIFEGGRFKGLRGTLTDISERKQAEQAQRESETNYRDLVEFIPVALFEVDLKGHMTSVNPAILEMFGYQLDDLSQSTNGFQSIAPRDRERAGAMFKRVLGGERTGGMEYTGVRKDGSTFPFMIYSSRIMREGVPVGVRGAVIDLTERKQAEEALRESEGRFRQLADSTYEGILIHEKGEILDFNKSFLKMVGYESHEVIGRNVLDFIPEPFKDLALRNMRWGYENQFELSVLKKDGTPISVDVHGRQITYRGRQVRVVTLYDVTGRKRAEDERQRLESRLQRAEKMEALGALAGGVAHDLNNVLGVLVGSSELMLMDLPEGNRLRRHALNILQSSQRGAAIIQDLLTLTRRGVAVSEVVNLNTVVANYLNTPEFEKLKLYHPHVTITARLGENLLNIKGSPIHLEKTVMNLVSNASEAISDRGEVTIHTENRYIDKPVRGYDDVKEGDYVVLTVSDNGEGISQEDLGKIFEPFYTKKVMGRSGTGLGLSVVWGTVKDHNGYVDVQSRQGKGSSFALYFPITSEANVSEKQDVARILYMGQGESILVVDDVAAQREIAVSILTRLGYRVHAVSSGEEAVEYLKTHHADLLVLDMIMDPGIDGFETYRQIAEIKPGQKAVIVSGFSETDQVRMAQDLGAGPYVRKPYIMEKIGMAIRGELDKP